jgi:hydrogenase expression/formation protein HypC
MCLAVPGRITAVHGDGELRSARIDFNGVAREVSLAFVPDAQVGHYVLVHVGFAIARVEETVAEETLAALRVLMIEDDLLVEDDASR